MRRLAIRVMVIGVFFLNSGAGVWAADKSDRLTPMDVFNIQTASDAQISPNGKQIVYVRQFADVMTDRRASNLWIINFDGSENRALTTGTYSDTSPRWSPDGMRIAYVSDRDGGKSQIYVRWMDSGQTAKLTDLENSPSGLDGRRMESKSRFPPWWPRHRRRSGRCQRRRKARSGLIRRRFMRI